MAKDPFKIDHGRQSLAFENQTRVTVRFPTCNETRIPLDEMLHVSVQSPTMSDIRTIGDIFDHTPAVRTPRWPPDVFAVVALILQHSGAYTDVVGEWPPGARRFRGRARRSFCTQWADQMKDIGDAWRASAVTKAGRVPPVVAHWWKTVRTGRRIALADLKSHRGVLHALLQLCATADEASAAVGLGPVRDKYDLAASRALLRNGSLCSRVPTTIARVLPKLHTPQTGLTLRSLTHHLALSTISEVEPRWYRLARRASSNLRVLVVPWPFRVSRNAFGEARGAIENLPDQFGFFSYRTSRGPSNHWLRTLLESARKKARGPVDMVVFPELSLSPEDYKRLKEEARNCDVMFVSGINRLGRARKAGENYFAIDMSTETGPSLFKPQYKHHRWQLDGHQIRQYGLQSRLQETRRWWEFVAIHERTLAITNVNRDLTLCVLICEDLARQEPLADLVRAVGPNLVIALLMDGPQLKGRWPARYATVLAEDPGSSVLTLTCAGMAARTARLYSTKTSNVVALWNDRQKGLQALKLRRGADGLVLNIELEHVEEWTADGRTDRSDAVHPVLQSYTPVRARS